MSKLPEAPQLGTRFPPFSPASSDEESESSVDDSVVATRAGARVVRRAPARLARQPGRWEERRKPNGETVGGTVVTGTVYCPLGAFLGPNSLNMWLQCDERSELRKSMEKPYRLDGLLQNRRM